MTYQDLVKFIKRHLWSKPNLTIDIKRDVSDDNLIEVKIVDKNEKNNT